VTIGGTEERGPLSSDTQHKEEGGALERHRRIGATGQWGGQLISDVDTLNIFWKMSLSMAMICKKCHWEALLNLRKSFSRHSCNFYAIVIKIIVTKVTAYYLGISLSCLQNFKHFCKVKLSLYSTN
jgi:hypothetical protein